MIVTPGDLSPEGLAAFTFRGDFYLAIANEVPAIGATTANTTLYRMDQRDTEPGWPARPGGRAEGSVGWHWAEGVRTLSQVWYSAIRFWRASA